MEERFLKFPLVSRKTVVYKRCSRSVVLYWICSSTMISFQLINNFRRQFVVCFFSLLKIRSDWVKGEGQDEKRLGCGKPFSSTDPFCVLWRLLPVVIKSILFFKITRTLLLALSSSHLLLFLNGSQSVFQFIYPLPREQGYEFMYAEFKDHKCYFTSLLHYQVRIFV